MKRSRPQSNRLFDFFFKQLPETHLCQIQIQVSQAVFQFSALLHQLLDCFQITFWVELDLWFDSNFSVMHRRDSQDYEDEKANEIVY